MLNFINDKILFEDLVFEGTEKSTKEAEKLLKNYSYQKKWIQSFLNFAASHRPFSFKQIAMLFKLTGKPKIKFSQIKVFPCYLYSEKIITKDDFLENVPPGSNFLKHKIEYEYPTQTNELAQLIVNDDIHNFVKYFNFDEIETDKQFININGWSFSLRWLVCYCGAMNILKYLIINGLHIDRCSCVKAIQGGSEECVQFLESKGHSFNDTLRLAIEHHQNKMAEWLWENYTDTGLILPFCVENFNTKMLLFLINTGCFDINQQDLTKKTSLHWSVKNGDYLLADYLLLIGADKSIKELYGKMAFDYKEKKSQNNQENKSKSKRNYTVVNREFQQLESCCLLI